MLVQTCAACQAPRDRARCGAHSALAPRRGQARPAGRLLESHSQIRTDCPTGPSEKRGRPDPGPASAGNLQAFSSPFLGSRQAERAARRTRAPRRPRESSSRQPQDLQVIRKRRIDQAGLEARRLRTERKHAARRAAALRIVHQHPHQRAAVVGEGR
jgi:hypothetical protein